LNEALEGSIATTWNPWKFHQTARILFWILRFCFRLQAYFHPVLSIFYLEHTHNKITFVPTDETPPIIVGVWAGFGR
jgi:hypothetical protein